MSISSFISREFREFWAILSFLVASGVAVRPLVCAWLTGEVLDGPIAPMVAYHGTHWVSADNGTLFENPSLGSDNMNRVSLRIGRLKPVADPDLNSFITRETMGSHWKYSLG
ncbi:hypothetical protein P175DRAFT_0532484 [Aspergillus ochraceoroseus IBT 24754]|uniref:Uncharacterized protein n=1 Tax=Aspergillus ochraceoroseus IBT 24754 TaxID=1392256 RepID=A0A2T5LXU5_9EURO|nr:uncharacterized protein P175DRAFT_0532484 [Aspergillus ochraceoroseus IBT 24754]PTU21111.1 hypothetical protein P175DRAFT_0532484 [Aspergillus ochraceoroseus IBT 24754]